MPIPKPTPKEKESEYVSRCMSEIGGEYDDNTQAVAICYATYRKEKRMSGVNLVHSKIAELKSKEEAWIKCEAETILKEKGINLAEEGGGSYPWDECIADQIERYGDEETATKVCGYIKSEYGS